MPTLRTVTVKAAGGDYTSLHAAVVAEAADLVALDRQLLIQCFAIADTTAVALADWTGYNTDTALGHYVRIESDATARGVGVWDDTKYKITATPAFGLGVIGIAADKDVRVFGIQVSSGASLANRAIGVATTPSTVAGHEVWVDGCIIRCTGATGTPDPGSCPVSHQGSATIAQTVRVRNTIGYGFAYGWWVLNYCPVGEIDIYNCTFPTGVTGGVQMNNCDAGCTVRMANVLIQGAGTNFTDKQGGAVIARTVLTQDATSPTVGLRNLTVAFVNAGASDYHLSAGDTAARHAGTDLSADATWPFSVDIDGQQRIAPWDVGADALLAVGGGTSPMFRGSRG